MSKVELRQHVGMSVGNRKEIHLKQYIVIYEGKRVGYKSWTESSPIRFVARLSPEKIEEVKEGVQDLLGDNADHGELIGVWPHEDKHEDKKGDNDDDIFD
jgi:hypothetical protein